MRHGGYALLKDCLAGKRTRDDLIKIVSDAGLRGLGGAGFPTGRKWSLVRAEPAPRLFAVNGDEGEPGTFKDRYYLERDPHRFLEGMLIAAWVVEAHDTYIYIRDEYPELRLMLLEEIAKVEAGRAVAAHQAASAPRRRRLYLRRRIRDDRIDRGQARAAAPSPALCRAGRSVRPPDARAERRDAATGSATSSRRAPNGSTSQGRHERKGFRSFSVSGRVKKPGVKLAPAGVTVRELIDEFCGGMQDGHTFKGYLPGGASGGILPASMADLPLDFGTLEKYGCFVGSHAVVILSDKDDMKAVALNLMKFFEDESCGQCTPCRVGTEKAVKLMERARGTPALLDRAFGADARRLDLRPRPGGAESADVRVEIFPGRVEDAAREMVTMACPGSSAARSDAPQTRDPA